MTPTERAPIRYQSKRKRAVTLLLSPATLSPHPLLMRVNMLPDLIAREEALGLAQGKARQGHKEAADQMRRELEGVAESIRANGIREKLKVVKDPAGGWHIADGRHRWTIAIQLGLKEIPCEEIQESEVVAIIMDGVQHRQMSKGGRAYLAVLMHPEVAAITQGKRSDLTSAISAEVLSSQAGVSPRLMEDAISIFRVFTKRGDIREKFEPAIWVGAGLAKLRAGIEGFLKTGTEPDEQPETEKEKALRLAEERLTTAMANWTRITTSLKHWQSIPAAGRREIIKVAAETIKEAPEDFRSGLLDSIGAVTV